MVKGKRTICVVTGSRADFGHLKPVIKEIMKAKSLKLQLVVTGMHLSSAQGLSYKQIEKEGIPITEKVAILKYDDSEVGIGQTVGLGVQKFSQIFQKLSPDLVLVLGDRYEIFAAAVAAYIMRICVAHIHGGESTQGAIDEGFRHSITKLAAYHFPAAEDYRRRIIQMGEDPARVFCYGAPALDNLYHMSFIEPSVLQKELKFSLKDSLAIVTYHPVTLESTDPLVQIKSLLNVLDNIPLQAIFTQSNADAHGSRINACIKKAVEKNPSRFFFVSNLGEKRYYSILKIADVMIGNSSSGFIEGPSFSLPIVNIGDRQKSRIRTKSVIDTDYSEESIKAGIQKALSANFRKQLGQSKNPYDVYGDGKTAQRIVHKLSEVPLDSQILKKAFYDIPVRA